MSEEPIKRLRYQAEEIANNNLPGWGNTMLDAANVLQQQAKELEALRGLAKAVLDNGYHNGNAFVFGLIDESGNPTKLLTGEGK